ncbi:hypothetical protein ACKWTF_001074 [Chironomus riparius]
MKLTLLLCLVLLSTIVLSVPVNINKNVDEVESMPESDDSKDELSRKFKGPIKIKKCAKPDQSFEYYQRWCPTTAMTTTTSTSKIRLKK